MFSLSNLQGTLWDIFTKSLNLLLPNHYQFLAQIHVKFDYEIFVNNLLNLLEFPYRYYITFSTTCKQNKLFVFVTNFPQKFPVIVTANITPMISL